MVRDGEGLSIRYILTIRGGGGVIWYLHYTHLDHYGVVHNFPKAVGVLDFGPLCTKRSQIPIRKEKGSTPEILASRLNNRW